MHGTSSPTICTSFFSSLSFFWFDLKHHATCSIYTCLPYVVFWLDTGNVCIDFRKKNQLLTFLTINYRCLCIFRNNDVTTWKWMILFGNYELRSIYSSCYCFIWEENTEKWHWNISGVILFYFFFSCRSLHQLTLTPSFSRCLLYSFYFSLYLTHAVHQ